LLSDACQRLLRAFGATCSMRRSGNVWDTSVMESFCSTLKIERCNRRVYTTRQAARADGFDYIERLYNLSRRRSTLGTLSPVAFERAMAVA
jgi:putative transposase